MKGLRFIAVLLAFIMLFSLVSCKKEDPHGSVGDSHGNSNVQQGGEGNVKYVYSAAERTLHLPDCYHIEHMNKYLIKEHTGDISELLKDGFTICRDCLVPDVEDDEPEEDNTNKIAKEDATFIINSNSKALHTLDCFRIKTMNESNIQYTDLTLEELINLDEYPPCSNCLPDEAKEWKKNHPDE